MVVRMNRTHEAADVVQVDAVLGTFELDAHVARHILLQQQNLGVASRDLELSGLELVLAADHLPARGKSRLREILVDHQVPDRAILIRFDFLLQFLHGGEPVRRIHRKRLHGDVGKRSWYFSLRAMREARGQNAGHFLVEQLGMVEGRRRQDVAVQDPAQKLLGVLADERGPERQDAVQRGAQRINVRSQVDFVVGAAGLFRGHESRGPHDLARRRARCGRDAARLSGQAGRGLHLRRLSVAVSVRRKIRFGRLGQRRRRTGAGVGRNGRTSRGGGIHDLGQAPVHDHDFAEVANHDVVGLQIAMHDIPGVREGHRIADFLKDVQQARQRILVDDFLVVAADAQEHIGQRDPLDILHRVENVPVDVQAQLMHRHDVRVFELRGDLRFADKARQFLLRRRRVLRKTFHRHDALTVKIRRLADHPHAALRENRADLVLDAALHGKRVAGGGVGIAFSWDALPGQVCLNGLLFRHVNHLRWFERGRWNAPLRRIRRQSFFRQRLFGVTVHRVPDLIQGIWNRCFAMGCKAGSAEISLGVVGGGKRGTSKIG